MFTRDGRRVLDIDCLSWSSPVTHHRLLYVDVGGKGQWQPSSPNTGQNQAESPSQERTVLVIRGRPPCSAITHQWVIGAQWSRNCYPFLAYDSLSRDRKVQTTQLNFKQNVKVIHYLRTTICSPYTNFIVFCEMLSFPKWHHLVWSKEAYENRTTKASDSIYLWLLINFTSQGNAFNPMSLQHEPKRDQILPKAFSYPSGNVPYNSPA